VPVQCDVTPLSGNSGRVMFQPPGGEHCLEDFEDFPAGTRITVPSNNDFRVGDAVVFRDEGGATISPNLVIGTTYFVVGGGQSQNFIQVSATAGGGAIALTGAGGVAVNGTLVEDIASASITGGSNYQDGVYDNIPLTTETGTGQGARADVTVNSGEVTDVTVTTVGSGYASGDTLSATNESLGNAQGPAGSGFLITLAAADVQNIRTNTPDAHIRVERSDFQVVCQVTEWSMDFSRDEIDVTTLPCDCGTGSKWANFRTTIPGPASGSGSMTVLFTPDQLSVANRLVESTMMINQMGATIKLYLNYVEDPDGDDCLADDDQSMYIEAPVSLLGFSVSATTTEALSATVNFSLRGTPTHMFYTPIIG